ncbi:hypothetical protein [Bradyrhizobium liaoningense]|uniref:hypothetical protein n=1 Tax=Bradyrhizobium liaoningense TaxID=43992 RepID=UPI001FE61577|nr:hypothetical protein [Bradyrhizobium liaoningense]
MPNHVHLTLVPSDPDGLRRALSRTATTPGSSMGDVSALVISGRAGSALLPWTKNISRRLRYVSLNPVRARPRPLGNSRFLARLERQAGRVLKPAKRGPKQSAEGGIKCTATLVRPATGLEFSLALLPIQMAIPSALEPRQRSRRPNAMAALLAELLFDLVRAVVGSWLREAAFAIGAWLDTKIHSRSARIVVGLLLGAAAFFLIPVISGLLGL